MNPSTFSANFLLSNSADVGTKKSSTCRLIDIVDFFFVAHPESGRKEGKESGRVFYYFNPKDESLEKQTQITGFAEAVVNFTENFTVGEDPAEYPYRYVNTAEQLHVYVQVESGKFIVGTGLSKQLSASAEYVLRGQAIREVLIRSYQLFRLFFGTFSRLLTRDATHLKDRLDYFFSRYLTLLCLHRMPLLDIFSGVDYLSLDSTNYLRVENFIDHSMEIFPQISKTMFFYQERLVSYSVSRTDLPVIFRYLTQNLLTKYLKAELQSGQAYRKDSLHYGRFLTCALDSSSSTFRGSSSSKPPIVYLVDDLNKGKLTPYVLVVYRALNATICMFLKGDVDVELLQKVDEILGPELAALASAIGDSFGTMNENSPKRTSDFHFIYYNPESLSLKTSFADSSSSDSDRSASLPIVPATVAKTACDTVDEFLEEEDFGEASVKLESDWWLTAKKVNKRILLIIHKNSSFTTLVEVQQYVNNVISTNFDSIFLT